MNTEAFNALLARFSWRLIEVRDDEEAEPYYELRHGYADGERVLGWIAKRPHYCDRGHWCVGIDAFAVTDLDGQDAFPRYFMRFETAQQELVEFMAWRLHKVRASD